MRYVSFTSNGAAAYGRLDGDTVVDLSAGAGAPADLKAAIAADALAGGAGERTFGVTEQFRLQ